ncbi:MAG: D-alanyl-D-alanine carboxypeptidase/D-alanyl-D-alanine-endopeptidase [Cyclobacteriaceae bacterium]
MLKIQTFIWLCLLGLFFSCKTAQPGSYQDIHNRLDASEIFSQNFTGFSLYDPESQKVIIDHNSEKYFTPASNTKLFTFYAGLKILGDSISAFKYVIRDDSLFFWGTGDPSFLHPDYEQQLAFKFLSKRTEKLFLYQDHFATEHFGPGWAWDDYNEYYSTEKAPFPIYGNMVRFMLNDHGQPPKLSPEYFNLLTQESKDSANYPVKRGLGDNLFMYQPQVVNGKTVKDVPFRYSTKLFIELLSDTLAKEVQVVDVMPKEAPNIFYSVSADSLYKVMLQDSDNFVAEQLILLCSSKIFDLLSSELTIDHVKENYLSDLPDEAIWMDGSGLSRYNLFTPRTMVRLLEKIYQEVPESRLFELFPAGGENGTIKNWYKAERPYIYAKTGSLNNNHTLSGYLITRKGKRLIFSFMNNNFVKEPAEIKEEMQRLLHDIHQNY